MKTSSTRYNTKAMSIKETIEDKISSLLRENQIIKNEQEETLKNQERKIDDIFCEFLTVIDTFERAEQTITERGLIQDENTKKAVNRLLNAKKKAMHVLEKFNVKKIEFENNHSNEDMCAVADTEPDPSRQTGDIISIEKEGYLRNGHLIRRAEVIIVKN